MRTILLTFALAAFAVGCGQKSIEPQSKTTGNATKVYSKAELDNLIMPGMTKTEITDVFGLPASEIQASEIGILTYSFPFEEVIREGPLRLTGFTVNMKDGKVVNWSPIMGESGKSFQAGAPQSSHGDHLFEMFVVKDALTNTLNVFDSEGTVDTSGFKISPDVTFHAKVFAGNSDGSSGETTVILVLNDGDVSKLKALTENNFGNRTLLVCRNKVIAAPMISVPITTKQFMFTVKNSQALDSIQDR